jgi:hypothetical protein
MKRLVPLALALAASCAVTDTPRTSSVTSALLVDATRSEDWYAGKQTIDDLWPSNQGITSMQILTRRGPDRTDGTKTFIAVVVWNHDTVGHIYWVSRGTDGSDFSSLRDNTLATRCNSNPDHDGGSDGTPYAGTPPVPHPNVSGYLSFTVDATFLQNAKDAAVALDNATGPSSAFVTYVTQ